jgi:hypothetical protein
MNHWLLCLFPSSLSNRPGFRNLFPSLVLLVLTASLLSNCQNHEDQPSPTVASPSTDAAPPEHSAASSPPPSQPPIPIVETQDSSSCCDIVANPDLKGRLGRLVVNFPEGPKPPSARIDVFKPGEQKTLVGGFGGHTFDLLPGIYDVEISKKRLTGVPIQSAHDTRVKVGVLQVNAGGSTRVDVVDKDGQSALTGGFGNQTIGLPVGTFQVKVAGQAEPVTIDDGKVTEF